MAKSGGEVNLKEANAAVFYKAFRPMDADSRRRLALRILKDEALLEDLYDHFLILEAEKEKGRGIPWQEVRIARIAHRREVYR